MKEYVVYLLPDMELEKILNDMNEEGYDVFKMYRNEPVAGVGRCTVVFRLRRMEVDIED